MKYEILTKDGWSDFYGVKKSYSTKLCHIILESGKELKCTYDHRLLTDLGWFEAQNIDEHNRIFADGNYERVIENIKSPNISPIAVYDVLEVAKNNQYYTNAILSHNCEFAGSSGTLISGSKLKELVIKTPIVEKDGLYQYEAPVPNNTYAIVVDVGRGKGLDYSVVQVIDVTKMPYKQVLAYKDNLSTPLDFTASVFRIAKSYNEAVVLIEINDIGGQVADSLLYDFEYENILYTQSNGRSGKIISTGGKNSEIGIRTTKTVKSVGCSVLKMLIEQDQLIVNDFGTINELSTFSKKGNSYEAESGSHDDLVMCLVLFAWLSDQKYFRELTDINTLAKLREKTEEEIESELLPFGFIDSGHDEPELIDEVENRWIRF